MVPKTITTKMTTSNAATAKSSPSSSMAMEKTTFNLPKDLLNQFRHIAIDKETTIASLVIEAMKDYLSNNSSK
jgi:hypothetical protein